MRRPAVVLFVALVTAIASAQDEKRGAPLPPPAKKAPVTAAANKLSNADRAFLVRAATRQGGGTLLDGVTSLQLHFGRVSGWQPTRQADGVTLRKGFDTDRAAFAWRRHDTGETSFIEHLNMNGKASSRCLFGPRKIGWFWAEGEPASTPLKEDSHPEDLTQLRDRRRLIGTLAELLVLRRTIADGSAWSRLEDKTHRGRAFLRRPPESARAALPFKIWIDEDTRDLVAVRIPPLVEGGRTQDLRFEYHAKWPNVHGATMRVPMILQTHERDETTTAPRPDDEEPRLILRISDITFTPLPNSVFAVRDPAEFWSSSK